MSRDLTDKMKLPQELLDGLYAPEFMPNELGINRFVIDPDEETEVTQRTAEAKIAAAPGEATPLTEKEAAYVDQKIEDQLAAIQAARTRIAEMRDSLDQQVGDVSFDLPIDKRKALKRAVKIVFGMKTNTITYEMYKAAVEAKRRIERDETTAYTKGEF